MLGTIKAADDTKEQQMTSIGDDENNPTSSDRQDGTYAVLPLRDIVVFPHMIVPLFVGREKSVKALEDVMQDDKQILLITQKNASDDDPTTDDIYSVGTVASVLTEATSEYLHRVRVRPAFRKAMDEVVEAHADLLDRLAR